MKAVMAATAVARVNWDHDSCASPGWRSTDRISYPPAASRVGTPRRKENSVAAGRLSPKSSPTMIDAPERGAPGKATATSCERATARSEERRVGEEGRS